MAVKTIRKTITDLTDSTTQELRERIHNTIENNDPLPPYLSIHLIDPHDSADYLQYLITNTTSRNRCPTAHFHLDPDAGDLPQHLRDRITEFQTDYSSWHNKTTITQNFSDDTLTFRLDVTFDTDGTPKTFELGASFDMWGLPESGMPTFNNAITYGNQHPQKSG